MPASVCATACTGSECVLDEVMDDDRIGRRGEQRVAAGEAVRRRQLDAAGHLDRPLPAEDVLEDGVDGHRAAGGDDHRPGVVLASALAASSAR